MSDRIPQPTNDRLCQQHGRRFVLYGLTHNVYGVPVDQVGGHQTSNNEAKPTPQAERTKTIDSIG